MHVVAVPNYDRSKIRCCEYFPVSVANRDDNGNIIDVDTKFLENDYLAYEKSLLDTLSEEDIANVLPLYDGEEIDISDYLEVLYARHDV